eukprot:2115766-Heterocapsa_arctica.AAC.1
MNIPCWTGEWFWDGLEQFTTSQKPPASRPTYRLGFLRPWLTLGSLVALGYIDFLDHFIPHCQRVRLPNQTW